MKPIKVALCVYRIDDQGGVSRVVHLLVNELCKKYNCSIVTFCRTGEPMFDINNNVVIHDCFDKPYPKWQVIISYCYRCYNFLKKDSADVVLIVDAGAGWVPTLAAWLAGVKIIYCDHGFILLYQFYKKTLYKFINRFMLENCKKYLADKIVTLTYKDREAQIQHLNLSQRNIQVIPNFIDTTLLNTCSKYNIKSKKIISVGRIAYEKGYEYLIEVAVNVLKEHPDWVWHIYGDGEITYTEKIQNIILSYGMEDKIILKGQCNNIYDIYSEYALYVMTSRHEGLPMVLLEAKAKKIPVVSFDINCGPSDIIRDGIDGYLIPPYDIKEMNKKICYLIDNPDIRMKFSNNSHSNLDKFKKEYVMEQWINLIDNVVCKEYKNYKSKNQ